jgi:hypothetical protein
MDNQRPFLCLSQSAKSSEISEDRFQSTASSASWSPHGSGDNVVQLRFENRRPEKKNKSKKNPGPTQDQSAWLTRGLNRPGGNLPLFDLDGQLVDHRIVRACVRRGWAKPWFSHAENPKWLVCRLTQKGRVFAHTYVG